MRATHREAEDRYESFRKLSREKILESLPYADRKLIKLEGITASAISVAKTWSSYQSRAVNWDWGFGYQAYSRRYPKRFELATWYGSVLAGLALGRPSYMGSHLRLDFVEALPEKNPLKGRIVPIAISVAELYGAIIGASQLRIIDPIHTNLIDYYTSFGYTYIKHGTKNHYLVKDLT
jgi:hypothetical protein